MKTIPRLNFAHLPTPIEDLPRLTQALGGPRILVKRDDQTGLRSNRIIADRPWLPPRVLDLTAHWC